MCVCFEQFGYSREESEYSYKCVFLNLCIGCLMAFQPPKSSIRKGVYWKISSKRFVTPSWFATVSMISMLGKPVRGWEKVMENWKDTCVVEVVIQYLLPFIGPDWKSKVGVDGWEYFFSGVLLLKFQ